VDFGPGFADNVAGFTLPGEFIKLVVTFKKCGLLLQIRASPVRKSSCLYVWCAPGCRVNEHIHRKSNCLVGFILYKEEGLAVLVMQKMVQADIFDLRNDLPACSEKLVVVHFEVFRDKLEDLFGQRTVIVSLTDFDMELTVAGQLGRAQEHVKQDLVVFYVCPVDGERGCANLTFLDNRAVNGSGFLPEPCVRAGIGASQEVLAMRYGRSAFSGWI